MSPELVKLLSGPISAENPSGTPPEEDPEFDRISAEIMKLDSLSADVRNTLNWGEVVKIGSSILSQRSKDLRVASWLCMGLFHQQGYTGLSVGFEILENLLENFWQTLYPPLKRMRGRQGAVIWLSDKLKPLISAKEPAPSESETIQNLAVLTEKLFQTVNEKFGDSAPDLTELRRTIQAYAVKMKAEERPSKSEAVGKPAEPRPPSAPSAVEFSSASDAYQHILRASAYLRESQADNPIPYRLNRIIKWHPILKLPSANNGRTEIPGILPQMVQGFQNLLNNAEWDKLLKQSETHFTSSPLWFDLQRFIDTAFSGLGDAYKGAQQAVREELSLLIRRLPGILDLQFKNGIPFADSQTKMWIEAEVMSSAVDVEADVPSSPKSSDNKDFEEVFASAKRSAASGRFSDAVSLLKEKLDATSLRRERFLWKLNIARLCMEAGQERLALPLLESLDNEVRQFSLEQWEPDLSIEVVRALLQCKRKLIKDIKQPPIEAVKQIDELYARLCQLDVLSVLTMDS